MPITTTFLGHCLIRGATVSCCLELRILNAQGYVNQVNWFTFIIIRTVMGTKPAILLAKQ